MSNLPERIAQMRASAMQNVPQAPSRNIQFAPGIGHQKMKQVSATIDLGFIKKMFDEHKAETDKLLEIGQFQYTNMLASRDQSVVDKEIMDNDKQQEILKEAYERGDNRIRMVETNEPRTPPQRPFIDSKTDPREAAAMGEQYQKEMSVYQGEESNNPVKVTKYLYKPLTIPKETSEAAAFSKLSPEQQAMEVRRPKEQVDVMSGTYGKGVANEFVRNYRRMHAPYPSDKGAAGDKFAMQNMKDIQSERDNYNKIVVNYSKYKDMETADPKLAYAESAKLGNATLASITRLQGLNAHLKDITSEVRQTGSAFESIVMAPIKDKKGSNETIARANRLINLQSDIVSKAQPLLGTAIPDQAAEEAVRQETPNYDTLDDNMKSWHRGAVKVTNRLNDDMIQEYARLYDWKRHLMGEQAAHDHLIKMGLDDDEINFIYTRTRTFQEAKQLMKDQSAMEQEQWKTQLERREPPSNFDRAIQTINEYNPANLRMKAGGWIMNKLGFGSEEPKEKEVPIKGNPRDIKALQEKLKRMRVNQ